MRPDLRPPPATDWAVCLPVALPRPPARGEVHVYIASLDEPPWPSGELHAVLDEAERARAGRFHFEVHRQRFAHGRGLMRHLVGQALGVAPARLRFITGPQGKPRLDTSASGLPAGVPLDFNLSHSGSTILLGLSDGSNLGVDIELPREVPELRAIAERNFAPNEVRELLALPATQQHDAFLACWTRKEAYVKALGGGLSVPLDGFEVSLHPDAPPALLRTTDNRRPAHDYALWAGRPPAGGWCALVVNSPGALVRTFALPSRPAEEQHGGRPHP